MTNQDKFQNFLDNLKSSGKSDEEIGKILADIAKLSGLAVYEAIMLSLTEEDMQEVEKIQDDGKAKARIEELFRIRTGMTTGELVAKAQMRLMEENIKTKKV